MTNDLFTQVAEPLVYAAALLDGFIRVSQENDPTTLPGLCAVSAAHLSQCELAQLYLVDEVTDQFELIAQHLSEALPGGEPTSRPVVQNQQLLHYVLRKRCCLGLDDVGSSLRSEERRVGKECRSRW